MGQDLKNMIQMTNMMLLTPTILPATAAIKLGNMDEKTEAQKNIANAIYHMANITFNIALIFALTLLAMALAAKK